MLHGRQAPAPARGDVNPNAVARLPKVLLVATGGTISNRSGGRLTADELVKSMPGLDRYVRAEAEQFANVASAQLTLQQWLDLARRINELFDDDPELAGVVVTSGTDTLEETAYFLHLTVRDPRSRWSSSARCAIRARSATKARRTCSRGSASRPTRRRAARACWWC